MDFMDYFASVGPAFLFKSPILVAWIVGIVLAARMLKKGGGKAERLLLIGCCLLLAESLISPFIQVLILRLIDQQTMPVQHTVGFMISIAQIPLGIIRLAGIVCLVYAFWKKFRSSLRRSTKHGSGEAT